MRQGIAAVTACVALCAAPAGVPITMAQARERAGSRADDDQVIEELGELTLARWIAGEARRRHVRVDPKRVGAGITREQQADGGAARWREGLAARGISEATDRAEMTERIRRDALVASITRHAHGQRAWSRAFADLNRRWRAATRCAPGPSAPRGRCANLPVGSDRCSWIAFADVCHVPSEWFTNIDLVGVLNPPGKELDCVPDGDVAVARMRRYLLRHSPAVRKRLSFDDDCDPRLITAKRRADLEVALRAVARLLDG